jgi:hypothetical protein
MDHLSVFAALALCFVGFGQQQNNQEPDLSSHKIAGVVVSYSQENRLGQILLSNTEDKFEQYFDIWGKSRNDASPIVITYVFEKRDANGRRFYTATWGKGSIERNAFNASCLSSVPDFKDDVYWAAKVVEGRVQFEPLEDSVMKEGVIKILFRSVKGTTQRWMFDSARPVVSQAPYDDQRILADLANREQNRKTWYTKGWLRPENSCVRYFQSK